jgi:hypothetical protein
MRKQVAEFADTHISAKSHSGTSLAAVEAEPGDKKTVNKEEGAPRYDSENSSIVKAGA